MAAEGEVREGEAWCEDGAREQRAGAKGERAGPAGERPGLSRRLVSALPPGRVMRPLAGTAEKAVWASARLRLPWRVVGPRRPGSPGRLTVRLGYGSLCSRSKSGSEFHFGMEISGNFSFFMTHSFCLLRNPSRMSFRGDVGFVHGRISGSRRPGPVRSQQVRVEYIIYLPSYCCKFQVRLHLNQNFL